MAGDICPQTCHGASEALLRRGAGVACPAGSLAPCQTSDWLFRTRLQPPPQSPPGHSGTFVSRLVAPLDWRGKQSGWRSRATRAPGFWEWLWPSRVSDQRLNLILVRHFAAPALEPGALREAASPLPWPAPALLARAPPSARAHIYLSPISRTRAAEGLLAVNCHPHGAAAAALGRCCKQAELVATAGLHTYYVLLE